MISRYQVNEIASIWEEEHKFSTYLKVELAIMKALEGNIIPEGTSSIIEKSAKINPERIYEIEEKVKHDVIAFCTSITENIDPKVSKYFHFGVTSSDIIDSALSIQIKESLDQIIPKLKELSVAIKDRAIETKDILSMGRSHGMDAEPLSFGRKLMGHYHEFERRVIDIERFYNEELTVQFSGAVGNYTILTPTAELKAAEILNMKVEPHSTQVIPRDRIAKLITINGLIASAIERLAVEIRHLHRSDVGELHEGFSKGQKGSSTMPHKKNPISGENLTGIARVIKSHINIALENNVLWHERDISHSSAERLYLPDNLGLLFYAINRMKSTVTNLVFHQDKIEEKVKNKFSYLSSYYLHSILPKCDLTREETYAIVQEAAFRGDKENSSDIFYDALISNLKEKNIEIDLPRPSFDELKSIFNSHFS